MVRQLGAPPCIGIKVPVIAFLLLCMCRSTAYRKGRSTMLNEADTDFDIASSWFRVDDIDLTSINGVSLGKCLQTEIYEELRPDVHVIRRGKLFDYLYAPGRKWKIRALLGSLNRLKDKTHVDVLFVCDNDSEPCIAITNILIHSLEALSIKVGVVVADGKLGRKVDSLNKVNYFSASRSLNLRKAYHPVKKIKENLKKRRDCNSLYRKQPATFYVALRRLGQVCRDVMAIESVIVNKTPKVIVVTSEASRLSKAALQLGKKHGIQTRSIPHGFPVQKYSLCPVEADITYVWSDYTELVLRMMDESCFLTQVVGCVNKGWDAKPAKGNGKVFFAPNPIDEDVLHQGFSHFTRLVRCLQLQGVVKIHPSQKAQRFLFEKWIPSDLSDVLKITDGKINEVGIGLSDVVFIFNSTVGIDAIACGAAVVSFYERRQPYTMRYAVENLCVEIDLNSMSDSSILDAYRHVLSFDEVSYLNARARFLNDVCGPNHELARADICADIKKIVSGKE